MEARRAWGGFVVDEDSAPPARWEPRRLAAWSVRAVTMVLPVTAGVATMAVASRVLPTAHGVAVIGRYGLLLATCWLGLSLTQRALIRLLPLALLLEMSLAFPDTAPSRLKVARRAGSATELRQLVTGSTSCPVGETTQQAAERILTLVAALARHDKRTRGHSERVRSFTDVIAEQMGLPQGARDKLRWAALLHDIGKLTVPAAILNKPGTPTAAEWEQLRTHPQAGADMAAPLMAWLGPWGQVIVQHHERFDRTGYPLGLARHDICVGARIVSVADTFDVITAARSYKRPISKELALQELVRCAGTQFDPQVVRALVASPSKKLVLVMGPTAWLAGIPFLGQAPAAIAAQVSTQAGVTIAAMTIAGATSLTPLSAAASTPAASTAATTQQTTTTAPLEQAPSAATTPPTAPSHPARPTPSSTRTHQTTTASPSHPPGKPATSTPLLIPTGTVTPPRGVPTSKPLAPTNTPPGQAKTKTIGTAKTRKATASPTPSPTVTTPATSPKSKGNRPAVSKSKSPRNRPSHEDPGGSTRAPS